MVIKVGTINPVLFKSSKTSTNPDKKENLNPQIKELGRLTPDFAISIPQKYTKLGVTELPNGLKIHSYKLANGHRISIIPMEGSPATVKNYVNVGSMNETDDIKGISHFLEHMAFNGTNGKDGYIKLNTGDSFKKIDKLGGWTNASTNYAITDYVNSTPMLEEKDLEEQIKIIAGMTEDLALTPEMIEKEKGPVCSEINMILDNPQTILTDQTVRTLFNIKSSADELVGGSTYHIKNLTREKVKAYYDKYYTPDNMNLVITGEVDPDKTVEIVSKNFRSNKIKKGQAYEEKMTPINKTIRKDFITDKAVSTDIMLGFSGPKNNDTKSKIIFDIISEYIDSTEFGLNKELKNINTSGSIALEKISTSPNNPTMLYYTLNCADDNSEKALKIIYDKFSVLKSPSEQQLANIKTRLLQNFQNSMEYSIVVNDMIGNSILNGEFESISQYENILNSITADDIDKFIKTNLDLNKSAVTLVHPQTTMEQINKNYKKASQLSFKGKKYPINNNKISEHTLSNNFKFATYETTNENVYFDINLRYQIPDNVNPATRKVLNEILKMGNMNLSEDEINKFEEENNLSIGTHLSSQKLNISGYSNKENFEKTFAKAKEVLYAPRITNETVETAINRIKDRYGRKQDSAIRLYIDNDAKTNPYRTSKEDLLKNIDSVTTEDVKKLYKQILDNSIGTVTTNIPNSDSQFKENAEKNFETLNTVKPYEYKLATVYNEKNIKPTVLTKEKSVSQADILQVNKFKYENNPKELAAMEIMTTILSASSIGLFNTLREKEHLAYSVYADIETIGDCAEISCNILTTTDNKEVGEISYDNLQKSINGFKRQINALINSEYTDEDLESAKRILKANLLNKEGTPAKLQALNKGLNSRYGTDLENKIFAEIDTITREDINNFAKKAFANSPTYAIVASQDTLKANREFLNNLSE